MIAEKITEGVKISVKTQYREEISNPLIGMFLFSYFVTIENTSSNTIQLLDRHWEIFDANAEKYEVKGEGVVGVQPILNPGEKYAYQSACELTSDYGSMSGAYTMKNVLNDTLFIVEIPKFELAAPMKLN